MMRWLAWTVLLLVGFAGIQPAFSQDPETAPAVEQSDDPGDAGSGNAGSGAKPATPEAVPKSDLPVEKQAIPRSLVVPEGIENPLARLIGAHYDSGKKLLTDQVGRCQFAFPAAPTYSRVGAKTKFAPIIIRNFELKMTGATATFAHTNYPKELTDGLGLNLSQEPYKILTQANDSQLKSRPGSKLVARDKMKVQGYPALEQVISYTETKKTSGEVVPAGVVFMRCILSGSNMFAISIKLDKKKFEENPKESNASVKKFMDSFRIIE